MNPKDIDPDWDDDEIEVGLHCLYSRFLILKLDPGDSSSFSQESRQNVEHHT